MDTAFFWVAKLSGIVLSLSNIIIFTVLLSYVLLWRAAGRKMKTLMAAMMVLVLVVWFVPVGNWLLHPLETRFVTNPDLPEEIDGIVVLAGGESEYYSAIWQQVELNHGAERNIYFMMLARQFPKAKLIFTGGSAALLKRPLTEADVAAMLYQTVGFDSMRVMYESKSRNTYENALLSKEIAKPKKGENWVLVTSAAHMSRAVGVFRKAGWDVIPYPVDHSVERKKYMKPLVPRFAANVGRIERGLREWVGLTAYYWTGKTGDWFPEDE
jgi:uncharacterized SAM-binding protein YcdF (DUF218 family)